VRQAILARLHRYTGLSVDYLDKSDLRVNAFQFCKDLLRERGETVGWLAARFLGVAFDPLGKYPEYDPQDSSTTPAFATEYQVSHLKLRKDLRSHIEIKDYDAGHMMYLHEPSLKKFKAGLAAFIDATNRL
jgi:carboxypeptidase C (cathepsin A)